jgi:two-component system, NtrC family, sensor kinase
MKRLRRQLSDVLAALFGGPLQPVLIACFSLVAALTIGLGTLVTSRVIADYLDQAMSERVARDMQLAGALYQLKLDEIRSLGWRLATNPLIAPNLDAAKAGEPNALAILDYEVGRALSAPPLAGPHFAVVLDAQGDVVTGRVLTGGELSPLVADGNWAGLPIVAEVIQGGEASTGTEVIDTPYLEQLGLAEQARLEVLDTPLAAPQLYDAREGTAGLTLTGAYPLTDAQGNLVSVIVAGYLFNNDFTLVDRIRDVAGIDTVTIFFGDLRVSTNVTTEAGERAVGTLLSGDVYDVVLRQGAEYVGRAFVVNDWFITRYEPLHSHDGEIAGVIYVGALESTFQSLVHRFNSRVLMIALITVLLAAVIAVPISRLIVRPVTALVEANRKLKRGDMTARVEPRGSGEIAMLGHTFNRMAATLQQTQQELLHKERLASMGQLAAGVAHEINNPLGTILLFADAMYRETDEEDAHAGDLKMIIDETVRCKNIVAGLLNFARQQELLTQETDVHALLERAIESVSYHAAFDPLTILREYAAELPPIQADPEQLQQVFINLLNNAAEAMAEGGIVTISTQRLPDGRVQIELADTGPGISEENLRRLFVPFFTTKEAGKGIGLGLSIVYGIIKMHRGQISVESREGEGTTFTITLPVEIMAPAPIA